MLLGEFAWRQFILVRRDRAPLLDLRLFRTRSFSTGLVAQFALWSGQASYFLVLALYLQQGRGLSPMKAGLIFTFVAASYLVASSKAPALAARHGRDVVTAGAGFLVVGHAALLTAVAIGSNVLLLGPGMLLAGAGMGLCIPALTTTVLSETDLSRAGAVSGALATVQQVGNALGVAIVGLVFFDAVHSGYRHAFELSLITLICLLATLVAVSRALPRGSARALPRANA